MGGEDRGKPGRPSGLRRKAAPVLVDPVVRSATTQPVITAACTQLAPALKPLPSVMDRRSERKSPFLLRHRLQPMPLLFQSFNGNRCITAEPSASPTSLVT